MQSSEISQGEEEITSVCCCEVIFPLLLLPELPLELVVRFLSRKDKLYLASASRKLATIVSAASDRPEVIVTSSTGWSGLCRDYPIPCLLPPNIARMLPDLQHLYIHRKPRHFEAGLQPIPYCPSLRKISYWDIRNGPQQLPSKYHSAEDLRTQLPNVDDLYIFVPDDKVAATLHQTMLAAWGHQLTKLHTARIKSMAPLPPCLRELHLHVELQEQYFEVILKLPALQIFSFFSFKSALQHDWSRYPCHWQQLSIQKLPLVELTKLPLHSLHGVGRLQVGDLKLPDPLLPSSLADVKQAAQRLISAGIVIENYRWIWDCSTANPLVDTAMAMMIRESSKVVQRGQHNSYSLSSFNVVKYPETTTAIIKWMCHTLTELIFQNDTPTVPWLWQALQCCLRLEQVRLIYWKALHVCVDDVIEQVQLAAKHMMAVTRRPIRLRIQCTEHQTPVQATIAALEFISRGKLPSSVTIEFCSKDGSSKELLIKITPL